MCGDSWLSNTILSKISIKFIPLLVLFITKSCPTLCDPMDCSTPALPVHHQLPGFTQTHWVGDAIQPSHPLSSPSPAFNLLPLFHYKNRLWNISGTRKYLKNVKDTYITNTWLKHWNIPSIAESREFTTFYNFICNSEVARGFLSITQKAENMKKMIEPPCWSSG